MASDPRRLRRDVGALGLLFASGGWIIGSGWLRPREAHKEADTADERAPVT